MAKEWVVLDPASKRVDEPGLHWYVDGKTLYRKIVAAVPERDLPKTHLYNPPGSTWLMPRPFQFEPDWYADHDGILHDFVLKQSHWTFSPEISSTVTEWLPSNKPGTAGPSANIWISIPQIPAGVTSLASINWTQFASALGLRLPSGMAVIARAANTPIGGALSAADYSPYVQWLAQPGDDNLWVMGWGNYAFVSHKAAGYFLRQKADATWELLGRVSGGPKRVIDIGQTFLTPVVMEQRFFCALPVGLNEVLCYFQSQEPTAIPVRSVDIASGNLGGGVPDGFWGQKDGVVQLGPPLSLYDWWIAAAPGQHVLFQEQVVGYDWGTEPNPVALSTPPHFDTGEEYKPTVAPKFGGQVVLRGSAGVEPIVTTAVDGTKTYQASDSGQKVVLGLIDDTGTVWSSDGTKHAGYIDLALVPDNPGTSFNYLCPQINIVELSFPVVLTDRDHQELPLNDTKFTAYEITVSLDEFGGKRGEIHFTDDGAGDYYTNGYHLRDEYPVEIQTDEDGDGVPDTVRYRAHVVSPSLVSQVVKLIDPDTETIQEIAVHTLELEGVAHTTDHEPELLPQLVDPDGKGFIEHTFCHKAAANQAGIDVDDATRYYAPDDPFKATIVARLPGYWGQAPGISGVKVDSIWAMDQGETFLQYLSRLGQEWSAWNTYEEFDGRIVYSPDLFTDLLGVDAGASYFVSATIYATKAAAAAAGKPGQYYLAGSDHQPQSPVANVVKVAGKDTEGFLQPTVICRDLNSITSILSPHYLGFRKVKTVLSKLAVGKDAMRQMCFIALQLWKQRKILRRLTTRLPYWKITGPGPVDVGRVLTFQYLGDYQIIHARDLMVTSRTNNAGVHFLQMLGRKLPSDASAGETAGDWPGIAAPPEAP
jgi:hypothetical protein